MPVHRSVLADLVSSAGGAESELDETQLVAERDHLTGREQHDAVRAGSAQCKFCWMLYSQKTGSGEPLRVASAFSLAGERLRPLSRVTPHFAAQHSLVTLGGLCALEGSLQLSCCSGRLGEEHASRGVTVEPMHGVHRHAALLAQKTREADLRVQTSDRAAVCGEPGRLVDREPCTFFIHNWKPHCLRKV
eukprot:4483739-Pleurochrysis_carterae.AAC.1